MPRKETIKNSARAIAIHALKRLGREDFLRSAFLRRVRQNVKEISVISLFSLVMINWLKGFLYSMWDTILPPFNPQVSLPRLFYIWDYSTVGGNNFIYLGHLPYHLIVYLLSFILPVNIANTVLFWILFLTTGLSMYAFTLETLRLDERSKRSAALVSAILYMFNPYWVLRIPSYFPTIWIIAFLPLLMLVARKALSEANTSISKATRYSVIASLITMAMTPGLATNIPFASATGLYLIGYLFYLSISRKQLKAFVITLLLLSVFSFTVHLWWIGPQAMNIVIQQILHREPGYISLSLYSLKWQTQYTTYFNLLRVMPFFVPSPLQIRDSVSAIWTPGITLYSTSIFILISVIVPVTVFIPLLSRQTLNASDAPVFALVTVTFLPFLAALNPPFGSLNYWLMENFPFYMFRRPQSYAFTLELSYSYMFGLGIMVLYNFFRRHGSRRAVRRMGIGLVLSLFIVVVVTGAFPFLLGYEVKINCYDVQRGIQPVSGLVEVPNYVKDLIKYLNETPEPGGVVLLPRDETLRAYNWNHGYFGLDVYYLSLTRPTLSHIDQQYAMYYAYGLIDHAIKANLTGFANLLRSLNIKYIIVAEDALANPSGTKPFNITQIEEYLPKQEDIVFVLRFGRHVLYQNMKTPLAYYGMTKTISFEERTRRLTLYDYIKNFQDLKEAWGGSDFVTKSLADSSLNLTFNYTEELREKEWFVPTVFNRVPLNTSTPVHRYLEVTLKTGPGVGVHVGLGQPGLLVTLLPLNPNSESLGNTLVSESDSYTFKFDLFARMPYTLVNYLSIQLVVLNPERTGNYTVAVRDFSFQPDPDPVRRARAQLWLLLEKDEGVAIVEHNASILGLSSQSTPPTIEVDDIGPTATRIRVANASSPFILVSTNTYDDDWIARLDGHPLPHIRVNLIFNGWLVNKTGEFTIEISYLKQEHANLFFYISMMFITAAVLLLVAFSLQSRRALRDGANRTRGFTIGFVGIDGSGKTTQAKELQCTLRAQGIDAKYVHLFSFGGPRFTKLPADSVVDTWLTKIDRLSSTKAGAIVELMIRFPSVVIESWISSFIDRTQNEVTIYDRYFYDKIVAIASSYGRVLSTRVKKAAIVIVKLMPKADVTIVFRMKPEAVIRRKNEHSLEDAKQICTLYDELARISPVESVDGGMDINEVRQKVQILCVHPLLWKTR